MSRLHSPMRIMAPLPGLLLTIVLVTLSVAAMFEEVISSLYGIHFPFAIISLIGELLMIALLLYQFISRKCGSGLCLGALSAIFIVTLVNLFLPEKEVQTDMLISIIDLLGIILLALSWFFQYDYSMRKSAIFLTLGIASSALSRILLYSREDFFPLTLLIASTIFIYHGLIRPLHNQ